MFNNKLHYRSRIITGFSSHSRDRNVSWQNLTFLFVWIALKIIGRSVIISILHTGKFVTQKTILIFEYYNIVKNIQFSDLSEINFQYTSFSVKACSELQHVMNRSSDDCVDNDGILLQARLKFCHRILKQQNIVCVYIYNIDFPFFFSNISSS